MSYVSQTADGGIGGTLLSNAIALTLSLAPVPSHLVSSGSSPLLGGLVIKLLIHSAMISSQFTGEGGDVEGNFLLLLGAVSHLFECKWSNMAPRIRRMQ